jgi:hypothetical protein
VVNFTPWPVYLLGQSPRYTLYRKLGGPQSPSWTLWSGERIEPLPDQPRNLVLWSSCRLRQPLVVYPAVRQSAYPRCKPKLSTSNKHLIYKTILKLIWTYGIQLWGAASTSNIEILERFESKALRMILDAPWYVSNTVIGRDSKYQQLKKKSAATALNTVLI